MSDGAAAAGGDRSVELEALERLDLLSTARDAPESGSLLEALVELKKLAPHQARAVRALIDRNAVRCQCGVRQLAPESGGATFKCRACGAALAREAPPLAASLRAPASVRLPGVGSRIGPLELVQVLGKGAYGTVFKARNHSLGRDSAVKVIPSSLLDSRVRRRFEREVEALARLRHPAIVAVHATHEVEGALALEMELVDGEDLEAKIRRGPLPWREAAKLVRTLARGVAHAHEAGVVHRDLKPANVLVRRADGAPQIVDFGLARFDDQKSSLTRAGAYVGTPLYMAPEAFTGKTSAATDIYGLGAILSQTVTGRAPFTASTPEELMVAITRGRCAPISLAGAPADLERVRARAMAPDPEKRYPDAQVLADDLERLIEGQPIRGARERKLGRAVAVLAAVAGGVVIAAVVSYARHGARPAPPPPPASASGLATPDDAIAALQSHERDPDRRAAALRLLGGPNVRPSIAALDTAVLCAPDDRDLRRIRALACQRERRPLDARDIFAASSDAELEMLAAAAIAGGVRGDPREAQAALRELTRGSSAATAGGASRTLKVLAAVVDCTAGDASDRDLIARCLDLAHGTLEVPRRLLAAMKRADAVAESVVRNEARAGALAESVSVETQTLAREWPLVPRVVLAPIARAVTDAWRDGALTDVVRPTARNAIAPFRKCAPRSLPPSLTVLIAVLSDLKLDPSDHPTWTGTDFEIADASAELREREPILAATGYELAASRAFNEGSLDDARRWVARAAVEIARPHKPGGDGEAVLGRVVRRRIAITTGLIDEKVAEEATGDPVVLGAALDRAIQAWQNAANVDREEDVPILAKQRDAFHLARLLLRRGRNEEAVEAMLEGPDREAMRAEVLRRRGEPARAREVLREVLASRPTILCWAVDAFAAIDLGDLETARKDLEVLEAHETKTDGPFIEELRAARVRELLEKK